METSRGQKRARPSPLALSAKIPWEWISGELTAGVYHSLLRAQERTPKCSQRCRGASERKSELKKHMQRRIDVVFCFE
jgi:hypothetical protein